MLFNFNVNFVTFFETALDAIWSFELILILEAAMKRLVGEEVGCPTGYPRFFVKEG